MHPRQIPPVLHVHTKSPKGHGQRTEPTAVPSKAVGLLTTKYRGLFCCPPNTVVCCQRPVLSLPTWPRESAISRTWPVHDTAVTLMLLCTVYFRPCAHTSHLHIHRRRRSISASCRSPDRAPSQADPARRDDPTTVPDIRIVREPTCHARTGPNPSSHLDPFQPYSDSLCTVPAATSRGGMGKLLERCKGWRAWMDGWRSAQGMICTWLRMIMEAERHISDTVENTAKTSDLIPFRLYLVLIDLVATDSLGGGSPMFFHRATGPSPRLPRPGQ